ncbi:MAG TPA: PAS domain S-box protein, partial [Phormidium sp.]
QAGTEQLYQEKNLPSVRALQGETVVVDDIEIRREGEIIAIEMRTVPVFNKQGKVAYAIAAFHDISDRKRIEAERQKAEKALRESEQRYADLAKAAPVGIFRNDLQGNCLYGNEKSFAMIGVTEKESFGAGWAQNLHPDDRDRVIATWYDFVQENTPFNCEYRFQRPEGSIMWVFGQAVAEKDSDGNIVGYVGTITDISERKKVEAALRESEAKIRHLAENIPGVIYRYVRHCDGSHEFTYCSPRVREFYGYEAEDIMQNAQLAWEATHHDDVSSVNESIQISAQSLQPWHWEGRLLPQPGTIKWIKGTSLPKKQPNGDIIWDGVLIDITEIKQAEEL